MDDTIDMSPIEQSIRAQGDKRTKDRSIRRTLATNSVQAAREHSGRATAPWSASDSDIVVIIMELLERVSQGE